MERVNELLYQLLGCSLMQIDRAYWAVKLKDPEEWVCEARITSDLLRGTERHFDWTLDLVSTGDVMRITELWLLCPANHLSPMGNTARLPIIEPGTAFQFKVASADSSIVATHRVQEAQIIGRVVEKETGACECLIWDARYQVMTDVFRTSVYDFGTWRTSLPPRGRLSLDQLGLKLD